MAQRKVPQSSDMLKREKQSVMELVALYPDGIVVDIDHLIPSLGKRLTGLYPELGYHDCAEMLEAWGFEVMAGQTGMEEKVSPEEFFAELARRHEGSKLRTTAAYKAENPDLPFTAMSSKAVELFGHSLAEEFRSRGLIAEKTPSDEGSSQVMGTEGYDELIDELCQRTMDLEEDDKPQTFDDIQGLYPDLEDTMLVLRKHNRVNKTPLQQFGIIPPSKALLNRSGIHTVPIEILAEAYSSAGCPMRIEPDSENASLLPVNVAGIDIEHMVELREVVIAVADLDAPGFANADRLDASFDNGGGWGYPSVVFRGHSTPEVKHELQDRELFGDMVDVTPSSLSQWCGASVDGLYIRNDDAMLKVHLRFVAALRKCTLAWILRELGFVRGSDLAGSMSWRARIRLAQRGKYSPEPRL